jgi:hypothetical protein
VTFYLKLKSILPHTGGLFRPERFWLWVSVIWAAWLVYSFVVVTPALSTPPAAWNLQNLSALVRYLRVMMGVGVLCLAEMLVWGVLVSLAIGHGRAARPLGVRPLGLAAALSMGGLAALLVIADPMVRLVGIPLGLACLTGVWIGWSWCRGGMARWWLLAPLALVLTLTALAVWSVNRSVFESAPLPLRAVQVTSADKRHLVSLFQNGADQNRLQFIHLTPDELDLLLNWALSIELQGSRGRLLLHENAFRLQASWALRPGQYVNIQIDTGLLVEAGELKLRLLDVRMGRLRIPGWVLDVLSREIVWQVVANPESGEVIRAIRLLYVGEHGVTAVIDRESIRRRMRELVLRLGAPDRAGGTVRIYVERLLAAADEMPDGESKFAGLLRSAFELAQDRSQDGQDPVQENRAAIYALGIVTGHVYVEWASGRVLDADLRREVGRHMGRATVRGRADWVRHYTVSAALAVWSSENASDAAGLLKEELDAGRGGSGFSFSDLLANRAGTTLAMAATADPDSARRIQQFLAGPWHLDQVFPEAADLPEGFSDAQMEAYFGGIGGSGYQELIGKIEARVSATYAGRVLGARRGR